MARRIIAVELDDPEWVRAGRPSLAIDHRLEVNWKPNLIWTAPEEGHLEPSACEVMRVGGSPRNAVDVYGRVISGEDKQWIDKACGPVVNHCVVAIQHIARVHELDLKDPETFRSIFKIEVLTGPDCEQVKSAEKNKKIVEFTIRHWWKFLAAALSFYYLGFWYSVIGGFVLAGIWENLPSSSDRK